MAKVITFLLGVMVGGFITATLIYMMIEGGRK